MGDRVGTPFLRRFDARMRNVGVETMWRRGNVDGDASSSGSDDEIGTRGGNLSIRNRFASVEKAAAEVKVPPPSSSSTPAAAFRSSPSLSTELSPWWSENAESATSDGPLQCNTSAATVTPCEPAEFPSAAATPTAVA
eukprot:TRINITY_DN32796_c0_g1_i1.p2 TRINITY_DN32796_c0_g1~~TRINITY_DN32796_c0_g1_i1.p2  ORF type:complete len:138 (+),score=4.61 TRINITY_DN32796_c0_g1_i1:590-1003(+)